MSIAILLASYSLDLSARFFWRLRAGGASVLQPRFPNHIPSASKARGIRSPVTWSVMPRMIEHEKTDAIALRYDWTQVIMGLQARQNRWKRRFRSLLLGTFPWLKTGEHVRVGSITIRRKGALMMRPIDAIMRTTFEAPVWGPCARRYRLWLCRLHWWATLSDASRRV